MSSLGPWSVMIPVVGKPCLLMAAREASAIGCIKRFGEGTSEELLSDTNITKARLIPDPVLASVHFPPRG